MMFTYKYPHPAVTADCVVFAGEPNDMRILLVRRGHAPYKDCWALPGGFMNIDETTQDAALRELEEETGLRLEAVSPVGVFDAVGRDPRERVISVAYTAWLKQAPPVSGSDDATEAQWVPLTEAHPLAFDHEQIIANALHSVHRTSPKD